MSETTTIGLDIAKHIFQVHGVAADSTVTVRADGFGGPKLFGSLIDFRAAAWALKLAAERTFGRGRSLHSATT